MSEVKSVKLAHLVRFGNGQDWKNVASEDGEFPVYGSGGKFGLASDYLHDGEAVLFGRKGTIDRPLYVNGKFWTVDTMYYAVPRPEVCDGKYLYYWATTIPFETIATNTALPSVTSMDLSQLSVPLPSLEAQQRIANYLDRETAEIDAAVADLDRYVELLKLRSKKLIASYLEGDYPRVKMGLLAKSITGLTYRPEDVVDHDGIHVYRAGNIQDSRIDRSDMVSVNIEVPRHLRFRKGDILMCSTNGSAKLVGKNAMVEPYDYGQTWGAFMRVIRSELNPYLYWFFRSPLFDQYRGNFSTSTINQLTTGFLNQIPVPLPTESERDEIVSVLNEETLKIDQLIAESSKLRDLLLKRRSVLINEVVTGRKQV